MTTSEFGTERHKRPEVERHETFPRDSTSEQQVNQDVSVPDANFSAEYREMAAASEVPPRGAFATDLVRRCGPEALDDARLIAAGSSA